jgi:predicted alpha-1,2-mannosidase
MVQLSPDTRIDGSWDGCSGYHYSDSVIYGFSHTHLSGTGCSDYGDVMIMPMMGEPSFDNKIYSSRFSHKNEKAEAGYYSVKLEDDHIDVELTATQHCGYHMYTFHQSGTASIIIDLRHRDKLLEGAITINQSEITGYRRSEAWARDQYCAFVININRPIKAFKKDSKGHVAAVMFNVNAGDMIMVKVGLSFTGPSGAAKNLLKEIPRWDFMQAKKEAHDAWNKELGRIEVSGGDDEKLRVFYTALYHTMIQPNMTMDVDSMYRGRDNKLHKAKGFAYYSVFSLWDTFRAAHPLYTIIDQKRTVDFINTFIAQYEEGGKLPVWELASNETECMIGYHSVSVIADAMVKGIKGFDYEKAFAACKHSAMLDNFGLNYYKAKGFISAEEEGESVSRTLEYAYDDWCIAQMARILKKESDYLYFSSRAQNWKNVFDASTGFMRPRKNGGWLFPFEPREVNNCFTEGNSWQYSFFVPQDVHGLIERMGGPDKFEKKLDELFTTSSKTTGRDQPDISGLIGQYAHGNEPSHHMAYLYNYIGKPFKTQQRVRQILLDFYKAAPDGLIGNEDCGQMSAWYVLSALGMYPVCPGSTQMTTGAPLFDKAVIHLENGKTVVITASGNSRQNMYVKESNFVRLNHNMSYFTYADLMNGGEFTFEMGSKPVDPDVSSWGRPLPFFKPFEQVPAPVIFSKGMSFRDSAQITLAVPGEDKTPPLYYFTGKDTFPVEYRGPFTIKETTAIYAFSSDSNSINPRTYGSRHKEFYLTSATFIKNRHPERKIILNTAYSPQYTADGDEGLIDGIRASTHWRKGGWQGYEGKDMEAVIDLGKEKSVKKFQAGFLQDVGAWIMMPPKVEYYISADGKAYTLALTVNNTVSDQDRTVQTQDLTGELKTPLKARYIKVKVYNYGTLPSWHEGAGKNSWTFIDEIGIE